MAVRPEITFRLPNSPGALAGVVRALGDERVGILALMLEPSSHLHLVVDNHARALAMLRERHPQVDAREVIAVRVSNAPGSLAPLLALAAGAGINVEYAYTGVGEHSAGALIVLGVDDAMRAATVAGL